MLFVRDRSTCLHTTIRGLLLSAQMLKSAITLSHRPTSYCQLPPYMCRVRARARRSSAVTYVQNRISFLSTDGHLLSIPTSGASVVTLKCTLNFPPVFSPLQLLWVTMSGLLQFPQASLSRFLLSSSLRASPFNAHKNDTLDTAISLDMLGTLYHLVEPRIVLGIVSLFC